MPLYNKHSIADNKTGIKNVMLERFMIYSFNAHKTMKNAEKALFLFMLLLNKTISKAPIKPYSPEISVGAIISGIRIIFFLLITESIGILPFSILIYGTFFILSIKAITNIEYVKVYNTFLLPVKNGIKK